MPAGVTLSIDATITERGQTTVPAPIRKMLGVQKGAITFKGLPDGTVIIEPKREDVEDDPVLDAFLSFLAADIGKGNSVPLTPALLKEIDNLVGELDIDLDAPLDDD